MLALLPQRVGSWRGCKELSALYANRVQSSKAQSEEEARRGLAERIRSAHPLEGPPPLRLAAPWVLALTERPGSKSQPRPETLCSRAVHLKSTQGVRKQ